MMSRYDVEVPKDKLYDTRHGGPWDRGAADSYYHRPWWPHFYRGATMDSERVGMEDMTVEELVAYTAGYNENEQNGFKKDYGTLELPC